MLTSLVDNRRMRSLYLVGWLVVSAWAPAAWAQTPAADGPPEWSDEPPVVSRLLEDAYTAQSQRRPSDAAARYCQAARLGSMEAQYRLGRLILTSTDDAAATQDQTLLALAAQRGHEKAAAVLTELHAKGPLTLGDPPDCLLTGGDPTLAFAVEAQPEQIQAVPFEVVERFIWALPGDKRRHAQLILRLAPRFEVDPRLALAIVRAESNFDADAVSPKNAQGLMQLIPDTAERFGVRNVRDPEQNVRGGLAYLRWLLARFNNSVALASAAYNAGEGAVDRHGGIPPYRETQDYVQRILRFYRAPTHQPPGAM